MTKRSIMLCSIIDLMTRLVFDMILLMSYLIISMLVPNYGIKKLRVWTNIKIGRYRVLFERLDDLYRRRK